MAVYKKTYRPYEGESTPGWSRFLVIPRYAIEDLHRSRFLTVFFLASFLYPLFCALYIYIVHSTSMLQLLNLQAVSRAISIGTPFFMSLLGWQSMLALFLAAFIGPGQISPDLANNGLPLYLARPFSRSEYVLGKLSVLVILLSLMTWVPGLLLFTFQGYLEGWSWMMDNARIASGVFFGSWIWILVLTLLALALSAWVKWKPAAGALLFGVFFVAAGFGATVNNVERTKWGDLFNITSMVGSVWVALFGDPDRTGAVFFRVSRDSPIPQWCCYAMLAGLALLCLYMLARKIRGAEVVR
ncbi:MAG TPA: ABC transporter permease subunit [Bryobacteraceae bacterium]|nr:ABC transporter permease subunit [Bryobacteraceae bacterium]